MSWAVPAGVGQEGWEINGNLLQCSCLENPRDWGAWWAAVYGVAQSRPRLKWLSSSSRDSVSSELVAEAQWSPFLSSFLRAHLYLSKLNHSSNFSASHCDFPASPVSPDLVTLLVKEEAWVESSLPPSMWSQEGFSVSHGLEKHSCSPHTSVRIFIVWPLLKLSEIAQSCPTLCNPVDCNLPGSPSMGFSRQEYWSGSPFPSPGDLPDPGIEPGSPALQADALTSEPLGKPLFGLCSKRGTFKEWNFLLFMSKPNLKQIWSYKKKKKNNPYHLKNVNPHSMTELLHFTFNMWIPLETSGLKCLMVFQPCELRGAVKGSRSWLLEVSLHLRITAGASDVIFLYLLQGTSKFRVCSETLGENITFLSCTTRLCCLIYKTYNRSVGNSTCKHEIPLCVIFFFSLLF